MIFVMVFMMILYDRNYDCFEMRDCDRNCDDFRAAGTAKRPAGQGMPRLFRAKDGSGVPKRPTRERGPKASAGQITLSAYKKARRRVLLQALRENGWCKRYCVSDKV